MKNQIKKSLSLIMAVIMLMSCWVWVAPTDANAATQNYTVKIKYQITNECEGGGHLQVKYWNFNADGTVNTGSGGTKTIVNSFTNMAEDVYEPEVEVPGFPYQVVLKTVNGSAVVSEVALLSVTIGNRVVSNDFDRYAVKNSEGTLGIDANGNKSGNMWGSFTPDWPKPKFGLDESKSTTSLDLKGIPSSATASFSFIDVNYNEAWPHTVTQNAPTVVLQKDGAAKTGMSAAKGSGNTTTVSASTGADHYNSGNSDSSWKLTASFTSGGVTVKPTVDVSLTHPEYTVTFDGNGGKLDASDAAARTGVYGAPIGDIPSIYDYKGYQLAEPAFKTDSGTVLKADSVITGNATYKAQWVAKDVEVAFLSADNQVVSKLKAKYNQTLQAHFGSLAKINDAVKASATGFAFNTNNELSWIKDGVEYQFTGWRVVDAKDLDGNKILTLNGQKQDAAVLQGDTVFQAVYQPKSLKKYTVKFYDTDGTKVLGEKSDYTYGQMVEQPDTSAVTVIAADDEYTYSHTGWAKKVGSTKYYTVDANGKDKNGANVIFVSKDTDSFPVEGNEEYVPVFRMTKNRYDITFKYFGNNKVTETKKVEDVEYGTALKSLVPEGISYNYTYDGYRYLFDYWYDAENAVRLDTATCIGDMTFEMVYKDPPEAAVYTINFLDIEGKLINEGNNQYEHNKPVKVPTVGNAEEGSAEKFDIPYTIETETARYVFNGWSSEIQNPATADATYTAKYTEHIYADVEFYNEGKLIKKIDGKENGIFVGDKIPQYTNYVENDNGEVVNVLPEKKADVIGSYEFIGWTDGTGNDVVLDSTLITSSVVRVEAKYNTVFNDYTVKFVNEGEVVSEATYHYGEKIVIPEEIPEKAEDESYKYVFRSWTPDVSETCYGKATYTADYRMIPKYYAVTWFTDKKTQAPALLESQYMYGANIQPATMSTPLGYDKPDEGSEWAFDYWVECDSEGNAKVDSEGNPIKFARGKKMGTEHLYFYPVFKQVENQILVTFYKDKEKTSYLGEMKIPYGKSIEEFDADIKALAHKEANETHHFEITAWKNIENDVEVDIVLENVSVYAEYTQEAHSKGEIKIIVEPTCTEAGVANYDCALDDCDYVFRNVTLDVIPDDAAPGGQLHVGENKWTLDDYKAVIDYSDVKYVGPQTMVIVNAKDFGSRSKNNPDAILHRGVGKVDYYVSTVEIDPSGISNWNNIYDYELIADQVLKQVLEAKGKTMQDYIAMSTPGNKDKKTIDSEVKEILATYNANATGSLSNLNLVNGSEYIIYLRISDREVDGSSNVSYLSSGKIHYGSTAATVTVSGDGFGTKFCADATIKVTDDTDGYKVYLDSIENEITLDADGEYKCEAKGVHTVTVIDKNGNITTKTFEIKGNHTNRQYVINATCENEGSRYNICTVCGAKSVEDTIPALGHSFAETFTDKAPTCVVDGYRTYVCGNNCGTKLVIKPTDDATTIAQAKKFVEPAEGEEEGTWVALTAADIEHLKATGKHTYPKVKDKDGNETDELAWVIDKASTCSVEGSKHIDCTVCGHIDARIVEPIPVDTVNGHKFYREKVTLEPTCTAMGAKTKTCRYCATVVKVADIPALGHIEGEYVVITPATCETAGSKRLTCARCSTEENPVYIAEPEEIPALDHAWIVDGKPEKMNKLDAEGNPVTDENDEAVQAWYQKYICANDNTHVKYDELEDYVEPVKATVTFKNGDTDVKVIDGYVGNVITAAQVTEKPEKAANATYNYTFKGWATKNADGTYTDVNFPIEVKGDATYYAVYTEKFVNYTITYYKEDGATEFKKTGYLHNGEEVTLADAPSKAETTLVEYKFAGWVVINSDPEVVYTDKATIQGANINLKATYTTVPKKYAITYAYSKSDILETFEVEAGTEARACAITPVKKADSKNHYEFKAWNKAAQLASVESNIYTTPDFETILHTYTHEGGIVTKSPATCDSNRIDTYTCTCGYTFDKEIPGTKREHVWGDRIVGTDGSVTKECTYEDCDAVDSKAETFTAKFFVNEADEKAIKTVSHIAWGTKIEAIQLPAAPTKENDANYTYTFKGWAVKGKTDVVDVTAIEIKADYEFVAIFTPTIREYNVIFAYDAYNTIETHTGVKAGSSVTFGGAKPTKVCDETKHYTFSGWIGYSGTEHNITITNIQSDLYILADFAGTKHNYKTYELSAATCTNGTGTRYWCDCNGNGKFDAKVNGAFVDHYEDKTGKPLPHNFEETKRVPATQHADGYVEYTCTVCKTVEKETLKYVDNVIDIKVTITVNGAAKSGIQVEIQPKDGVPFFATTNANGVASAEGTKGVSYTAYATIDGEKVQVTLKEDANGNITGSYNHEDKDVDCSCACHRNNVWGSIFRFFHKIIKLFTGKFKCCGNPDPMYG